MVLLLPARRALLWDRADPDIPANRDYQCDPKKKIRIPSKLRAILFLPEDQAHRAFQEYQACLVDPKMITFNNKIHLFAKILTFCPSPSLPAGPIGPHSPLNKSSYVQRKRLQPWEERTFSPLLPFPPIFP